MEDPVYVLTCTACGKREYLGMSQAVQRLMGLGMLRREKKPNVELIVELLCSTVPRMACKACQAQSLELGEEEAWEDDWVAKKCEDCGNPIDPQRLEVFPQTKLCVACQLGEESGEATEDDVQYCSQCGNIMQVRQHRRGITRYELVCPVCRK